MTKKFLLKNMAGLAFAILGLLSCNKEDVTQSSSSDKIKTESYYIELEADDLGEARLAQVVDAEGRPTSVFLEDKDLRVQLAVRRKGESTVVTQIVRMQRVRNQAKVRYTGYVNIPAGRATTVQLSGAVISELSGTSDSPTRTDMRFLTEPTGDYLTTMKPTALLKKDAQGRLHIPIPYVADWQDATLSTGLGNVPHRIVGAKLTFKPSGTILRFQLSNKLTKPVKVSKILVKTNVFVDQWRYNLKTGVTTPNTLFQGEPMTNVALPLVQEQRYEWTLPAPVTIPAATSTTPGKLNDWYYVSVMGTSNVPASKETVIYVASEGNTGYADVFKTEDPLKPGTQSVALELRPSDFTADFASCLDQGALQPTIYKGPLSYLKTITKNGKNYAMIVSGREKGSFNFIDPTTVTESSEDMYYTYGEALSKFGNGRLDGLPSLGVTVNGHKGKYGLPTIYELGSIFPGPFVYNNDHYHYSYSDTKKREVLESVQFVGEEEIRSSNSWFKTNGSNVLYALRFTNLPERQTAFRYEWSNGDLTIRTRFIGSSSSPTDWDKESYWAQKTSQDLSVTFRALGSRVPSMTLVYQLNQFGAYRSSTRARDKSQPIHPVFSSSRIDGQNTTNNQVSLPVVLVPRN